MKLLNKIVYEIKLISYKEQSIQPTIKFLYKIILLPVATTTYPYQDSVFSSFLILN